MLDTNSLEGLNTYANILQIASYEQLLRQADNDDIMQELDHQNQAYLEQIIKIQTKILRKLERLENERFRKGT